MEWDDATIARLRALWDEDLSTAEIGRRMQMTKNAIVGKAHRLLLPARPSPIRRLPDGPRPSKVTRRVPTIAELQKSEAKRVKHVPGVMASLAAHKARREAPEPFLDPVEGETEVKPRWPNTSRVSARERLPVPGYQSPHSKCQWPEGCTKPFLFCGDPVADGRSYCEAHVAVAYVKILREIPNAA